MKAVCLNHLMSSVGKFTYCMHQWGLMPSPPPKCGQTNIRPYPQSLTPIHTSNTWCGLIHLDPLSRAWLAKDVLICNYNIVCNMSDVYLLCTLRCLDQSSQNFQGWWFMGVSEDHSLKKNKKKTQAVFVLKKPKIVLWPDEPLVLHT